MALTHITSEVVWTESLLNELRTRYLPLKLLFDNLNKVMLSHNPILHAHTKHIELDIQFVRKSVVAQRLQIHHVPPHAQISNILTKSLPTNIFSSFRGNLKVASFKPP